MPFQKWYLNNAAVARICFHHCVLKVINPECPSTLTFFEGFHQQKKHPELTSSPPNSANAKLVVWGPPWFGFLGFPYERDCYLGWQNGCCRWWVDVGWLFTPNFPGEFFPGGFLGGSNGGFLGQFLGWQKLLLTDASWISFEATFAVCKSISSASQSTSCWLKMGDYNLEWNLKDQFPASPKP